MKKKNQIEQIIDKIQQGPLREKFDELFPKDDEAYMGGAPSKSNRSAGLLFFAEALATFRDLLFAVNFEKVTDAIGQTSDGYHTFDELYEHRHALFLALAKQLADEDQRQWEVAKAAGTIPPDIRVWRSKRHSDGTMFDDCFVMGINQDPGTQITYHLPGKLWADTGFAVTLSKAPQYDGHTSADVVERLKQMV